MKPYELIPRKDVTVGQMTEFNVRLVVIGFQEMEKPQSDSPTVAKKSLKLLMVLVTDFEAQDNPLNIL